MPDWDKKVTLTYRRLVDICKMSYEYPKTPISYWLSSKDWAVEQSVQRTALQVRILNAICYGWTLGTLLWLLFGSR